MIEQSMVKASENDGFNVFIVYHKNDRCWSFVNNCTEYCCLKKKPPKEIVKFHRNFYWLFSNFIPSVGLLFVEYHVEPN